MEKKIETTEFFLAAWLLTNKIPLVGHTREKQKSTFTFEGDSVDELINEYFSESAETNIAKYATSIRQLKSLMYGGTTFQPINKNEQRQQSQTKVI